MGNLATGFSKLIDSSEMACSLKFEDVKGCPYNSFTPKGIAALSFACSFFAIVSLFVAA